MGTDIQYIQWKVPLEQESMCKPPVADMAAAMDHSALPHESVVVSRQMVRCVCACVALAYVTCACVTCEPVTCGCVMLAYVMCACVTCGCVACAC